MGESAPQIDAHLESGEPRTIGRYVLYSPIARGGMATIHIARLVGDDGFSRIVAAKRLHAQFTEHPDFVEMFRDEAEIASKVRHPNVVPVLDIVLDGEEVVLVQEYVHGVPLDRLFRVCSARSELIPPRIVAGIMAGVLSGLHAAHEAVDDQGHPLGIIHRDVSPQNILVTTDGIPRLLDFGIARARSSAHVTRAGLLMGKIAYMPPEQVRSEASLTRRADVYSSGVVLWELLALRRMHTSRSQTQILSAVLNAGAPSLLEALEPMRAAMSNERWDLVTQIAPIVTRATAMRAEDRFASAAEMLRALLRVVPAAGALEVADWVKTRGSEYLERRQEVLARVEESWRSVSKIAVATPTSVPLSGVQRVRPAPGVVTATTLSAEPRPVSAMYVPIEPAEPVGSVEPASPPSRLRYVPWAVALGSLAVSAVLVATIVTRRAPVESAPAPAPRETAAVAAVAPPPPVDSSVPAISSLAIPVAPVKPVHAAAAAPARKAAAEPSASTGHVAAPVATTPAPVPRTDCDPPFYFEGTKKVFKPSCI